MKFYIALTLGFLLLIAIAFCFGISFYGAEHHDRLTDDWGFNIGVLFVAAFGGIFYACGRYEATR